MKTRILICAAGLLVLAACGDSTNKKVETIDCDPGQLYDPGTDECVDNPSNNANNSNNASNNANNTNNVNNLNNVNNTTNNVNNINNINNINNTTNNTNPNNTSTNNTTNNTNPNNTNTNNVNNATCTALPSYFGQIGGVGAHDGGTPQLNGTLSFDAGLGTVLAAVPFAPDDPLTIPAEGSANVNIAVNGALVTATGFDTFADVTFWIGDRNTGMRVRLDNGSIQPVTIQVGQRISFTVTKVTNFEGTPQIALIGPVTVDSFNNAVPIKDATGTDLAIADFARIARVWGTITSSGTLCGGASYCFDLTHGQGNQVSILRTQSAFIENGDCVTFVGPVSSFPGPLTVGSKTMQLDQTNFSWAAELF